MIISGNNVILEWSIINNEDIQITGTNCTIRNCTLFNGIYNIDASCIIVNSIGYNPDGDDINVAAGQTVTGTYNCFMDSVSAGPGTYSDTESTTIWGTDPLFVNVGESDFHLQNFSSCVNAGENSIWVGIADVEDYDGRIVTNSDGKIRVCGGIVDIGAYIYEDPYTIGIHKSIEII